MGDITPATRFMLLQRDKVCVCRGQLPGVCAGRLEVGHLRNRGMGGTPKGDIFDGPGWTVLMCHKHNRDLEQDAGVQALARDLGLSYPKNSLYQPGEYAIVRYPDGQWWALDPETGRRRRYNPPWLQQERTDRTELY